MSKVRPTVFISYSHRDKPWKDRLVSHLKALGVEDLDVWDDHRIGAGADWLREIQAAMDRATVAVLLVSADFLTSGFIRETEVPHLLNRRRADGLRVTPLIVRPCGWRAVDWLQAIQARPKDGKALSGFSEHQIEEALTSFAWDIRSCVTAPTASPLSRGGVEGRWERGPGGEVPPRLDLDRLPVAGPLLIGRETELARLDAAWESPEIHVLTFVAFGGTGKSTLVSHWLDRMSASGWRGARCVLAWSFYKQGTEDRVTSAESFFDHALAWFGDPTFRAGAPRDRGLRLAELVRNERTLIILDGVEPLQHPPSHAQAGQLKDPGLAAFLKSLAGANLGLCVVTSRERITDLNGFARTAPQEDLESLSPEAGAELLRQLGVRGKDSEFLAASREFGNHALTLSLLGNYLRRACGGDIRRRRDVNLVGADQSKDGHAFRVIGAYSRWLGKGPEIAILRLLGLFDRPADPKALEVLRSEPVIPGLTDGLRVRKHWWSRAEPISEEAWELALSNLREHGLLLPLDPNHRGKVDAHPLLRAFFREDVKGRPKAWTAGNQRLYEHLQREAPDLPETPEAMEPLYSAVVHGCRAGRQQEALETIYWRRIRREDRAFNLRQFGAFGSDLAALSGFFDRLWDLPSSSLDLSGQAFVLNAAGYNLRALGRLTEAVQPMEAGMKLRIQQEQWGNAAQVAANLNELALALGQLDRAMTVGKMGVDFAERSEEGFHKVSKGARLADVLHQSGQWEESATAFRKIEALQVEFQPEFPILYSFQGYQYCALMLSCGEPPSGAGLDDLARDPEAMRRLREACRAVMEKANRTLSWSTERGILLDVALDNLSLGRAYLGLALSAIDQTEASFAKAGEHLDQAVQGLQRAGQEIFLPWGFLARAVFRRLQNDLSGAEGDLSEALEIAERGSMRLHECDVHLEWARLCRTRGDRTGQQEHVARARKLVEETGYLRRMREVEWLEANPALERPGT